MFSFWFTLSDTFVFICRRAKLLHKFSYVPLDQILASDYAKLCYQIWAIDIIIVIIITVVGWYWLLGPKNCQRGLLGQMKDPVPSGSLTI